MSRRRTDEPSLFSMTAVGNYGSHTLWHNRHDCEVDDLLVERNN